ncbi:MAG TPA: ROK family protein [Solirubrobacteraceae bacterium]|nr:ROK family protein [Solirubrobacteraceae bacterium]
MAEHGPGAASVVAVDVGGTTMKGALVDAAGAVVREASRPTPAPAGSEAVVEALLELIAQLRGDGAAAVGVVVPGHVDAEAGCVRFSANLGLRDLPLRARLERATGLPVRIDHDVRAAGLAEDAVGATTGVDDSVLVVIGTGVAAVVRSGGRVIGGATGAAGELGHIPVWPDGEPCRCGQRGCLERYASASAIARRYADRTTAGAFTAAGTLTAADVLARRAVDEHAQRVWDEAIQALALAFSTATMLLDPQLIVIGGGLSNAGGALLEPVRAELGRLVRWREPPRVVLSPLRARGGLIGAALLAREIGIVQSS